MSNYSSQVNLERLKRIRLRVTVPSQSGQSNFVISVGQQWTISQVANRALSAYIELYVKSTKISKNLTVKAVRIAQFYMAKSEKVIDLLQNDDWIVCQIIRVKGGGYEYQQRILEKIAKEEINKMNKKEYQSSELQEQRSQSDKNEEKQVQWRHEKIGEMNKLNEQQQKESEEKQQNQINIVQNLQAKISKKEKNKQKKKRKRQNKSKNQKIKANQNQTQNFFKENKLNLKNLKTLIQPSIPNIDAPKGQQLTKKQINKQTDYQPVDNEGLKTNRKRSLDKRNDKNIVSPTEKCLINPLSPKTSSPKIIFHQTKMQSPSLGGLKETHNHELDQPFSLNKELSTVTKKHVSFMPIPIINENDQPKQKLKKDQNNPVIKPKTQIIVEQQQQENQKPSSPKVTLETNQNSRGKTNSNSKFKDIDELLEKYRIQDSQ